MPDIASAATAVLIGHIVAGTSTLRIGASGIILPNHAPTIAALADHVIERLIDRIQNETIEQKGICFY